MSGSVVREMTLTEEEILAGRGIQKKVNGRDVVIPQLSLSRLTEFSLDFIEMLRGFQEQPLSYSDFIKSAPPKAFELIGKVLDQPAEFVSALSVRQLRMLLDEFLLLNGYEGGLESFFGWIGNLFNRPLVPSTTFSRSSTNGASPESTS